MSQQAVCATASLALTWRIDFLFTLVTLVAGRSGTLDVVTFVDLCVGVTQLDGNVSLLLVLETNGVNFGNSLDHCRFTVSDVANGSNIDRSLAGNNLRCKGGEGREIHGVWVGLLRELWAFVFVHWDFSVLVFESRLQGLLEVLLVVERLLLFNVVLVLVAHEGRAGLRVLV